MRTEQSADFNSVVCYFCGTTTLWKCYSKFRRIANWYGSWIQFYDCFFFFYLVFHFVNSDVWCHTDNCLRIAFGFGGHCFYHFVTTWPLHCEELQLNGPGSNSCKAAHTILKPVYDLPSLFRMHRCAAYVRLTGSRTKITISFVVSYVQLLSCRCFSSCMSICRAIAKQLKRTSNVRLCKRLKRCVRNSKFCNFAIERFGKSIESVANRQPRQMCVWSKC